MGVGRWGSVDGGLVVSVEIEGGGRSTEVPHDAGPVPSLGAGVGPGGLPRRMGDWRETSEEGEGDNDCNGQASSEMDVTLSSLQ
jgi:hypothetical protein